MLLLLVTGIAFDVLLLLVMLLLLIVSVIVICIMVVIVIVHGTVIDTVHVYVSVYVVYMI